ncbi:MAG: hypothetical protein Ct9H300mP23_03350 [Nitrospinota bacterium]|nr:MAG: hypothetical protein Ct9H300mP23_03350 [Nitrospinota bacterium]
MKKIYMERTVEDPRDIGYTLTLMNGKTIFAGPQ